jgi:hypothetical protein
MTAKDLNFNLDTFKFTFQQLKKVIYWKVCAPMQNGNIDESP